jgi:uncharacterized protein YrzB (UPF0473 family)
MSNHEKEHADHACDCHEEDCGCDTITLELQDGTKQEFIILDTVTHRKKHYVALAPTEGDEYFIYGFNEAAEGEVEFYSIEDEKEFDGVAKVFEKRFAAEDAEAE